MSTAKHWYAKQINSNSVDINFDRKVDSIISAFIIKARKVRNM